MPIVESAHEESYYAAAMDENRLIGTVSGSIIHGLLILIDIRVEQNSRRNGWGGQLYDALENWAVNHHATALIGQFNPDPGCKKDARAFYYSQGISIDPIGRMFKRLQ